MKKIIVIVLCMISMIHVFGQKPSNINGTTDPKMVKKVSLGRILNGRVQEIATSIPDSSGRFAFRFTPEAKGIFTLSVGNSNTQLGLFRFYFNGNDELNVRLGLDSYSLTGKNSKENNRLYAWDLLSQDVRMKALRPGGRTTYVDFFPQVETLQHELAALKKKGRTGNRDFDALFDRLIDYDFAYYAISFLYMPRSAHPSAEELTPYYSQFRPDDFLTEVLLQLPYGDRFLSSLSYRKIKSSEKPSLVNQLAGIPVDVLKGQFILQQMERLNAYEAYAGMYEQYSSYLVLPEQQERAKAIAARLVDTKAGKKAFAFSYPDLNGKHTRLADLQGKIVVLDVWATWCGPCKAEEPFWEELNGAFQGKDVVFVGISMDQDKAKWEKYVPEKKLKGLQLHAGPGNDLAKAYKINGIPRYLVIDKNGDLISSDAPRPSDPKLKQLLDTWLVK